MQRHLGLRGWLFPLVALALVMLVARPAWALTPELARALVEGDSDSRVEALNQAVAAPDERATALIRAIADDAVKFSPTGVYLMRDDKGYDPVTGAEVAVPADAEDVVNNNRMRRELGVALAAAKLSSPDAGERLAAARTLQSDGDAGKLPILDKAYAAEKDAAVRDVLERARSTLLLASDDKAQRLEAAKVLAGSGDPAVRTLLAERLAEEPEADVKAAIGAAIKAIDGRLAWGEGLGVVFTGISLGSILLLVALGLAITYGLMGVINMAHGELMMIGAYATYVVQNVFRTAMPGLFDYYILAAIPASFLAAALVGAVLERGVIRWLYGRPLETLLATWGISLMLMQLVRTIFGAQNVQVENPAWLSGGMQVMGNLTLPYNRIAIIVFAGLVLMGVAMLIARTRLGLFVRGVTQNRRMASCVGVNTARVDTYAFSLGAGIAGLAGCALSQVGNVGPDLGQSYIVDSFLVVVVGGVGQLAGTVFAALGLGMANKVIEGWTGAVLAKITVLVLIVVFIQKRPQGLFAMKGRSAEA